MKGNKGNTTHVKNIKEQVADEYSTIGRKKIIFQGIIKKAVDQRYSVDYVLDECKRHKIYLRAEDCAFIASSLSKTIVDVVLKVDNAQCQIPDDRNFRILLKKCQDQFTKEDKEDKEAPTNPLTDADSQA